MKKVTIKNIENKQKETIYEFNRELKSVSEVIDELKKLMDEHGDVKVAYNGIKNEGNGNEDLLTKPLFLFQYVYLSDFDVKKADNDKNKVGAIVVSRDYLSYFEEDEYILSNY